MPRPRHRRAQYKALPYASRATLERAYIGMAIMEPVMNGDLKLNILVVDDEAGPRHLICRHLEKLGHNAVPAESGVEAIRKVTEEREAYDLVVLDMLMPVQDGEATFDALHKLKPELAVLLCTGSCDPAALRRLLRTGWCDLLCKPFSQTELRSKIAGLLARAQRSTAA